MNELPYSESPKKAPLSQRLKQHEHMFRLLVSSVQDYAIFMLDPSGVVMTWNQGAERFTGYTADEIIGKHFSVFYPRDARVNNHPAHELEIAEREGRYEEEGWRIRKDGTKYWANVVITALFENGKLVGFGKVTRDLTEHRQLELERELASKRDEVFRLLVSSVKDYAIFMLDRDGHIMTWNEGAQRIKGYKHDEIVGKHFSIFYTEQARAIDHPQHELEIAKASGRYEEEGWRVRKDGTQFWANVVITALFDEGRLVGFAKVTRDLTERKMAEEQRELNSRRVMDTNAELQRLAYIVSHELQAPIATIVRYGNLLKARYQDRLGSDAHDFIGRISEGSRLIARMIDDLWNYARLTKPEQPKELIYLGNVLGDALTEIRPELKGGQVIHGELPSLEANRQQMAFLFKELLLNACKYRSKEPLMVEIDSRRDDTGWLITFQDNGIGIDNALSSEVFKLFHRLVGGPEPEATGIGLAICKKIVEQHNGRIWFDSQSGRGTKFFVWLPEYADGQALTDTGAAHH